MDSWLTQAEQSTAAAETAYSEAERLAAQAPGEPQVADALSIARQGVLAARLGLARTRATADAREQSNYSGGAGHGWARAEQGLALTREAVARTVERRASVQDGTMVAGWDLPAEGLDCPPGFIVRVRGMSSREDRAYWYPTRQDAEAVVARPGFLASHGPAHETASIHAHAGGPARLAWSEPIAAPTGHVRLAWLALLGVAVLLLAAPTCSAPEPIDVTTEEGWMQFGCGEYWRAPNNMVVCGGQVLCPLQPDWSQFERRDRLSGHVDSCAAAPQRYGHAGSPGDIHPSAPRVTCRAASSPRCPWPKATGAWTPPKLAE